GARTNIQDNAVFHTDDGCPVEMGEGCTVGHGAIVHGCRVGERSLIGMGAVILNRAQIGRFCLVGAQSLVTEGKIFPDYSLILGNPARVVRTLSEDEIKKLGESAERYVRRAQVYRQKFEQI